MRPQNGASRATPVRRATRRCGTRAGGGGTHGACNDATTMAFAWYFQHHIHSRRRKEWAVLAAPLIRRPVLAEPGGVCGGKDGWRGGGGGGKGRKGERDNPWRASTGVKVEGRVGNQGNIPESSNVNIAAVRSLTGNSPKYLSGCQRGKMSHKGPIPHSHHHAALQV